MADGSVVTLLRSNYPGLVIMVAGLVLSSFASGWWLFAVGAVWSIGALWHENWETKKRLEPRLSLTFDKGQLFDSLHDRETLRVFRVGVTNSGESVTDVSVKVAKIYPELPRVFPMQELHVTHADEGVSRFTLNRSHDPLVYVDVVYQRFYQQDGRSGLGAGDQVVWTPHFKGHTASMWFKFAACERQIPLDCDQYLIWLAIDGAGAGDQLKLVLTKNDKGQYDMKTAFS